MDATKFGKIGRGAGGERLLELQKNWRVGKANACIGQEDALVEQISAHLGDRQVMIVMLLAKLTAAQDVTPKTFVLHVLKFYEAGLLDSVQFLFDWGFLRPISLPDFIPFPGAPADKNRMVAAARAQLGEDLPTGSSLFPSRYEAEYEEIDMVSRGAFGEVWRAQHRLDGREYAIKKVYLHQLLALSQEQSQKQLEVVLREVQCLAQLDHPNTVRYHTAWLEQRWLPRGENTGQSVRGTPRQYKMGGAQGSTASTPRGFTTSESLYSSWSVDEGGYGGSVAGNEDFFDWEDSESGVGVNGGGREGACGVGLGQLTVEVVLYIQMQFYPGMTLKDVLARRVAPVSPKSSSASPGFGPTTPVLTPQGSPGQQALTAGRLLMTGPIGGGVARTERDIEAENVRILREMAQGLAHVHASGIIHRDLKPENVMFGSDGTVKIGDFGLSTLPSLSATAAVQAAAAAAAGGPSRKASGSTGDPLGRRPPKLQRLWSSDSIKAPEEEREDWEGDEMAVSQGCWPWSTASSAAEGKGALVPSPAGQGVRRSFNTAEARETEGGLGRRRDG
eukprot:CAMPEP_0113953232 /NCGR_PEP_ID=MMETSP1339-20121228/90867_1 /TAXON_ID=94617 /ORGANISM="Fibrocapsa japonica" /LENGTH=560 /DNA_ID=CAMNT_0000961953 /DNA_START=140 /DNA_END=1819 /DNA_ORIENTATION=- /assembly_acc=CAM_ASM_000762